jgi:hypothetical protein
MAFSPVKKYAKYVHRAAKGSGIRYITPEESLRRDLVSTPKMGRKEKSMFSEEKEHFQICCKL